MSTDTANSEFRPPPDPRRDLHGFAQAVKSLGWERTIEQLLATIILNPGEQATAEELVSFCTGKIARHKIPRYWEFVSEVPMTASGKVQKYKIVEQYASKYAT